MGQCYSYPGHHFTCVDVAFKSVVGSSAITMMVFCYTLLREYVDHFLVLCMIALESYHVQSVLSDITNKQ